MSAALLAAFFILWFMLSRFGDTSRKTSAGFPDLPPILFEKGFLPYLSPEEVMNDPLKAIKGLAGLIVEQDARIKILNVVLQDIDEGVLLTDSRAKISFVNHGLLKMLSQPNVCTDIWVGCDAQGLVRAPQLIRVLEAVNDGLEQDKDIRIVQNDREMDVAVRKIDGTDGGQLLMVFSDVSGLIRSERAARDLIANVAHQLRTPLTSIKGYAETLIDQDSIDMETSRRFLTIILKNADRLTGFVRDVLILTQLDGAGGLKDARPVRLKDVMLKAVETATPLSEEKGIRFMTKFLEEEVYIRGIPSSIEQAVANLLDNAIKYTAVNTTITITLEKKKGEAILSVSDEGPGIPCEALDKVFERFYRLERDRTEGTGLGLSIVKQTAQLHKGRAWAESQLGRGATFYIAIPVFSPDSS